MKKLSLTTKSVRTNLLRCPVYNIAMQRKLYISMYESGCIGDEDSLADDSRERSLSLLAFTSTKRRSTCFSGLVSCPTFVLDCTDVACLRGALGDLDPSCIRISLHGIIFFIFFFFLIFKFFFFHFYFDWKIV